MYKVQCSITIDLFNYLLSVQVQRSITIDLLFYYLHTYVDNIYYHVPFHFIKSINSKNKKTKRRMYNFLFEHLLKEQTKHKQCII